MADYDITSDLIDGSDVDAGLPAVAAPSAAPAVNTGAIKAPPGTQHVSADAKPPVADKSVSLREQLTKAFKGEAAPVDPNAVADTPPAPVTDAQGRIRNADGTFAPTPAEVAAAAAPAAPAAQSIQPPANMSPVEAQMFTTLPPEMQQFVARTMQVVEQSANRFQSYAQLEPILEQRRQAWAMNGMSEGQALNQLLALSDFATNKPAEFAQWFANSQGLDLAELSEGMPLVDPQVAALQQQIQQLQGTVNQYTTGQQQAQHSAVVNEIAQFAEEKSADGQPLRPYFSELGATVLPFIQAVKAENPNLAHRDVLTQAYDRACWGNPAIRAKMSAADEAKRLSDQRVNAGRAAAAGSSVTGAPVDAVTASNTPERSLRDELRANFSKYN